MKRIILLSFFCVGFLLTFAKAHAQEPLFFQSSPIATQDAVASDSATVSARVVILPDDKGNITLPVGQAADRLEQLLSLQKIGELTPLNVLQHAIRRTVSNGVSATTIAFILLFPVVASLIAFARHIVGLSGLSMYAPAALAVALLSMGVLKGSFLFFAILIFAMTAKRLLGSFKLPYLPRTAMILWLVSFGVFGVLVLSTYTQLLSLSVLNVFALLILILLSENFLEAASASSLTAALQRVAETFILGLLCSIVMGSEVIQSFVLLYPELTFALIGLFNIVIGRYLGLRFTEWLRFRQLADEQE